MLVFVFENACGVFGFERRRRTRGRGRCCAAERTDCRDARGELTARAVLVRIGELPARPRRGPTTDRWIAYRGLTAGAGLRKSITLVDAELSAGQVESSAVGVGRVVVSRARPCTAVPLHDLTGRAVAS